MHTPIIASYRCYQRHAEQLWLDYVHRLTKIKRLEKGLETNAKSINLEYKIQVSTEHIIINNEAAHSILLQCQHRLANAHNIVYLLHIPSASTKAHLQFQLRIMF